MTPPANGLVRPDEVSFARLHDEGWEEHATGLLLPDGGWEKNGNGLWLQDPGDDATPADELPTVVELFAGCGGAALGFHQAGFHCVGASEWDVAAVLTLLINLGAPETHVYIGRTFSGDTAARDRKALEPYAGQWILAEDFWDLTYRHEKQRSSWVGQAGPPLEGPGTGWIRCATDCPHEDGQPLGHDGTDYNGNPNEYLADINRLPAHGRPIEFVWMCDVHELNGAQMLETMGIEPGQLGCVSGGPPCQGFSSAGKRNVMDPRNSLVFEFARLVLELNPKAMMMENVPTIMSMVTPEGLPVVDALCHVLADGNFSTLDALRRSLLQMKGGAAALRKEAKRRAAAGAEELEDGEEEESDTAQMAMELAL